MKIAALTLILAMALSLGAPTADACARSCDFSTATIDGVQP
jgi:hypothetical protein